MSTSGGVLQLSVLCGHFVLTSGLYQLVDNCGKKVEGSISGHRDRWKRRAKKEVRRQKVRPEKIRDGEDQRRRKAVEKRCTCVKGSTSREK